MSELLDSAARRDADRAAALDRNDCEMAHGITRVGLAKVSGKHLSLAENEPFAVQAARQELQCCELRECDLQAQFQGYIGGLPA